jgi:hypothetical protein
MNYHGDVDNEIKNDSELFWLAIFKYISNGYLIFFSFSFYNIIQLIVNRF